MCVCVCGCFGWFNYICFGWFNFKSTFIIKSTNTPKQTQSFKGAVGHIYQLFTRDSKANHSPSENLRYTANTSVHMATELFRGGVTSPPTALFPRFGTVLTHSKHSTC